MLNLRPVFERSLLTQREIAEQLKCSRSNVTAMLDPKHNLTVRSLARLAKAMGYKVEIKFIRVKL